MLFECLAWTAYNKKTYFKYNLNLKVLLLQLDCVTVVDPFQMK